MNKLLIAGLSLAVLILAGVVAFRQSPAAPGQGVPTPASNAPVADASSPRESTNAIANHAVQPVPAGTELDARRVALGRTLFHDRRLSKDGTISCASCHDLAAGGADGRRVSVGVGGAEGEVNSPTVFNAALNFRQFWDGRAESLEEQIDGPVTNPKEMATNWPDVVAKLERDAEYRQLFGAAYGDGVTAGNVRDAIATFERSLLTPNSRFDRFLEGDADALTPQEKEGYALFQEIGCITCHQGANLGGNSFQTFGLVRNFFEDRGQVNKSDFGRFNVTGKERDKFKFKVPTLRNITKTAPYLHDGSAATLEEAVQIMARYQLGHDLEPAEVEQILGFLATLDGQYGD